MSVATQLDQQCINTLRTLSIDAVQQARRVSRYVLSAVTNRHALPERACFLIYTRLKTRRCMFTARGIFAPFFKEDTRQPQAAEMTGHPLIGFE